MEEVPIGFTDHTSAGEDAGILLVLAKLDNDRARRFAFCWTRHFVCVWVILLRLENYDL